MSTPAPLDWQSLDAEERAALLRRPAQATRGEVRETALQIIEAVRREGDAAVLRFTREFDGVALDALEVDAAEVDAADAELDPPTCRALDIAIGNVRRFHEAQCEAPLSMETTPGVRCERRVIPITAVGLYVPAGRAPLPSTAIMLAVPAQIADCPVRVLATPPRPDGLADPAVLYVARRCAVQRIFKMGGAQAIAALAYGTQTVPQVDKIFGPGNAWVTAAKQLVALDPQGAASDLPAGPSEVLVIADDSASAEFVAADLLAQAEHSPDAQVVLVSTSDVLLSAVRRELELQLASLPRRAIAARALEGSRLLRVPDLATAFDVSNVYAPEHLILEVVDARSWLTRVTAAGSVFLGSWSPETMGDYCSGANHVLPTDGHARAWSGLSLQDFTRHLTVQELTPEGLRQLGPVAQRLAQLEGLEAHARAVRVRLEALEARGAA
jgi:histidinol dehydrogenase